MNTRHAIGPADRLSGTLVFALLFHLMVALGVSFNIESLTDPNIAAPSLDVILVSRKSPDEPEDADYLAQFSQSGGGNVDEKLRPQAVISGTIPKETPGIAPQQSRASQPVPMPVAPLELITSRKAPQKTPRPPKQATSIDKKRPTASQLIQNSMEMARLESEIGRKMQAYAKRPRRKFISANTKEYLYASYMQAWVSKVERVGNLNYPDEARRKNLSGSLVLAVAIDVDGQVININISHSSGHRVLDDAAIRIVQLAAPYAPMPASIREKTDILHITRTWQFLPGNRLIHK